MIKLFKKDVGLKLISVSFAFFMWIYVMAEVDPMVIRDFSRMQVQITNIEQIKDSNMIISPDSNLSVRLILRGRRSLMKDVKQDDISVHSSIENPHTGKNTIDINVETPPGITYTLIPDGRTSVDIEEYVVQRRKVDIQVQGAPKDGFVISNISLNPEYTFVDGPKSLVESIDSVKCVVDVSGKPASFNSKANIVIVGSDGKEVEGVGIKDKSVYVEAGIQKRKEVPIQLQIQGEPAEDYGIKEQTLSQTEIIITGDEEDVEKIDSIKTEILNIDGISEAWHSGFEAGVTVGLETKTRRAS